MLQCYKTESNSKTLRLRAANPQKASFLIKCNSKILRLRAAKNQGNLKFLYKY
jgi:hypothetical protein